MGNTGLEGRNLDAASTLGSRPVIVHRGMTGGREWLHRVGFEPTTLVVMSRAS